MKIIVANRQRQIKFDLRWLQKFARRALVEVTRQPAQTGAVLADLTDVEVTIVSDAAIAQVHEEFMKIPGPTDVLTFAHGEILISAETAQQQAAHYRQPLPHELGLYLIHGLLHLSGCDDQKPNEAARMRQLQAKVLQQVLAAPF